MSGKASCIRTYAAFSDLSYSLFIASEKVPDELKHIPKWVYSRIQSNFTPG